MVNKGNNLLVTGGEVVMTSVTETQQQVHVT